MNIIAKLSNKYRQAEWRTQRQWIGLILLGLVIIVLIAGAYLNVEARTSLAGREIQNIEELITTNEFVNADLEAELAYLTSDEVMAPKATAIGYRAISPDEITYITVLGYAPNPDFKISNSGKNSSSVLMDPAYTESLIDWLVGITRSTDGIQP